jgi:hypothetical protein
MNRRRQILGLGIMTSIAIGLGYAGWRLRSGEDATVCQACGRAIHANMRTIAFLGNKRELFCCPTCALSAGAQMRESVRFEQLTDYETEQPLRPADAFAVEGSDMIPCIRSHQMRNMDGQTVPMDFDRCSPSIIAFANQTAAARFASQYGGRVDSFLKIVAQPVTSPR